MGEVGMQMMKRGGERRGEAEAGWEVVVVVCKESFREGEL